MYTYKYRCQNCNHKFTKCTDEFTSYIPGLRCPKCGSVQLVKLEGKPILFPVMKFLGLDRKKSGCE